MKIQLQIRIIMIWLFCVVCSVNTEFPQEQFLNDVNGLRRVFAKIHNLSEIYELIWSYILEEKLNDGQRFLTLDRNTNELMYNLSIISQNYDIGSIYNMRKTKNGIELLAPGYREIACVNDSYRLFINCLMGPNSDVDVWRQMGKGCDIGYWNNRGLCSVETTTTAETETTTETTATKTTETTIGSTMRNSIAPITITQKRSTPLLTIQRSANAINGRSSQNKGISAEDDEQSGVPWLFYISLLVVLCIFFKCAVFNSV